LTNFKSDAEKAAYERYVSGVGNAGSAGQGFRVTHNGNTVTITKDGKSTTYDQGKLDLQLAADKSRAMLGATPQGGTAAGPAAPVAPTTVVTSPTADQLAKYNALSPDEKKFMDGLFASNGLKPGIPAPAAGGATAPTPTPVGGSAPVAAPGSPVPVPIEPAKPPTVAADAPYVDIVSPGGGRITNLTQDEAAKYVAIGGYTVVPQGSTYTPPAPINTGGGAVAAPVPTTPTPASGGALPPPTATQLAAYNNLDATQKAQSDAYFAGLKSAAPTGGGTSATFNATSNAGSLPVAGSGTRNANNGFGFGSPKR
jgi:hypothetical protein